MIKRSLHHGLGIGLVVVLGACQAPVERNILTNVDESHPRAKLIVGSSELLGTVVMVNPIFRPVGNLTQTQVELQNYSDFVLELEYRIDWRDADGFQAGNEGAWQFLTLTANGSEYVTATGKVPEARDITLTVRLPDTLFEPVLDDTVEE